MNNLYFDAYCKSKAFIIELQCISTCDILNPLHRLVHLKIFKLPSTFIDTNLFSKMSMSANLFYPTL